MGLKNKEVEDLIVVKFKSMEGHLNAIEEELGKEDSDETFSKTRVAMGVGKLTKLYEDIAYLMGIFDGNKKY